MNNMRFVRSLARTRLGWSLLFSMSAMLVLAVSVVQAQSALSATASAPRFKVLALAEDRGHHVAFTLAAKPWLKKFGEENGFEVAHGAWALAL